MQAEWVCQQVSFPSYIFRLNGQVLSLSSILIYMALYILVTLSRNKPVWDWKNQYSLSTLLTKIFSVTHITLFMSGGWEFWYLDKQNISLIQFSWDKTAPILGSSAKMCWKQLKSHNSYNLGNHLGLQGHIKLQAFFSV